MALTAVAAGQANFLMRGGSYELPLHQMREKGTIDTDYVYREYPKFLRLDPREIEIPRTTEDCKGRAVSWTETKTVYREVTVNSEEEEERVLSGGKTSAQIEAEREGLFARCRHIGIHADPSWSVVRLRRELGDALDAPAPSDEMGALKVKLAQLEEMAAMKAKIAALEAQLAAPDEAETIRGQLAELGVKCDGRWSLARLREELDKATA